MVTMTVRPKRDEGFTLVELLVYSLLLVVVIAVVGGLFISSTTTQQAVGRVTDATKAAQLTADSIESGVRNASAFTITTPTGTDQLLRARTVLGDSAATWTCMAWYYQASGGGSIRYTKSSTAISATPSAATLATWTLLESGVSPTSGTTIFSGTFPLLNLSFKGLASGNAPVGITSSAVSRTGVTGSSPCY
jgi:Tfp pilus assembly protein PilW